VIGVGELREAAQAPRWCAPGTEAANSSGELALPSEL